MSFPVIEVVHGERTWPIGGLLRTPDAAPPANGFGAVVIVHGSNGLDSRGEAYAAALNAAGLASLEIDLWTARGVTSPQTRPRSPVETLPDAFAALACLAGRPEISARRIGLMGFSWGGVVTMLAATRASHETYGAQGPGFAGFAPLYPVCWAYNTVPGLAFGDLVDRPVLIQAGAGDLYDDPGSCERLAASLCACDRALVSVITYPHATHAWDRREPDIVAMDPFSHKGAGGPTPFAYNREAARRSTAAVVAFFASALASDLEGPD